MGNGSNLNIANIGSATLQANGSSFNLQHILHCLKAYANLLSIQHFCIDNSCYFVLTSDHFFIKDIAIRKILLQGKSENGLYPIQLGRTSKNKTSQITALLGIKTSTSVWHLRLGYPHLAVLKKYCNVSIFQSRTPIIRFHFVLHVNLQSTNNYLFIIPLDKVLHYLSLYI